MPISKNDRTTMPFVNFMLKGKLYELTIKQLCFFVIQKERNLKNNIENQK